MAKTYLEVLLDGPLKDKVGEHWIVTICHFSGTNDALRFETESEALDFIKELDRSFEKFR